jgi:hypothetical protein
MALKDPEKHKEYMKQWYQAHKEEVKERSRKRHEANRDEILLRQIEYRKENSETIKEKQREFYKKNKKKRLAQTKEWAAKNPVKRKTAARRYELGQLGWTLEMYNEKFAEQNGRCAICKQAVEAVLDADHEHVEPPKPRGLLCHLCNIGIGAFKDDPAHLIEAINYLRKFGK